LNAKQDVPAAIKKAMPYFLEKHARVRNIEGEGGIMVTTGKRVVITAPAVTNYLPSNRSEVPDYGRTPTKLRDIAVGFQELVL